MNLGCGQHMPARRFYERSQQRLGSWRGVRCCACCDAFGLVRFKLFELQFQLLDLMRDLLALLAEDHPLQLGDDQLEMFDLAVAVDALLAFCDQQRFKSLSVERLQIGNSDSSSRRARVLHAQSMSRVQTSLQQYDASHLHCDGCASTVSIRAKPLFSRI